MIAVLIFYILLGCFDGFFWTLGPLVADSLHESTAFGGLFLTGYYLPVLVVTWIAGTLSSKYGKKRTAYIFMILGSLVLTTIGIFSNPIIIIAIVFIFASFSGIAWPSIKGASADYISETPKYEKEIEGLTDLANNIGYIIGPIIAGILADKIGNIQSFSVLGIAGVIVSYIILRITPKKIHIPHAV